MHDIYVAKAVIFPNLLKLLGGWNHLFGFHDIKSLSGIGEDYLAI